MSMTMEELNYYYNKFKFGEDNFHNLMQFRVKEILLVSTFYDAFIFEQDGRLSEQIFGEYRQLNLSTAPRVTSVPTGYDALKALENRDYDLVILMMRIGEISPFELSRKIKDLYGDIPVLLLLNVQSDIVIVENHKDELASIDDIFIWNGDTKLFLAMVKSVEDKKNLAHDTDVGLVRIILLVEDSIHFYSVYLPLLYSVIMKQTQRLIQEEVNDINKRLRMRARPKVILVHSYEDALKVYEDYKEYLVTVISDVKYSYKNELCGDAGIRLISKLLHDNYDLPMILQSSEQENENRAKELNITFINKNSKNLLQKLRDFIINNLGYGDFIFRDSNGVEIESAKTMLEFESKLVSIPNESLLYHSRSNHFSIWLIAHGEVLLAKKIRPMKVEDFTTVDELRNYLITIFSEVRILKNQGKIINFDPDSLNQPNQVIRLADGSLGGKGRGLAFLNALLVSMDFDKKYPDIWIKLPSTAIVGTSEFDYFIESNEIHRKMFDEEGVIKDLDDLVIDQIFLSCQLSEGLTEKLKVFIEKVTHPIAIRSSGLLEDSQSQPFAGIYRTYMLPNNHPEDTVRLNQLSDAIKLVFSSVYLKNARSYIEGLNYKTEEEKMAVIIQEIAGRAFDNSHYYPHISGVAQSYNFYPTSFMSNSDGIAALALGLGKAVVEGKEHFRFSPKHPKVEELHPEERIQNSQKEFYALDLKKNEFNLIQGEETTFLKLGLKTAEKEGTLQHIVSVWDYQDNRLIDGIFGNGKKIITFANILKYDYIPLADIISDILEIGEIAMGIPVEIEFAVNLHQDRKKKVLPKFYILQIRPLSVSTEEYYFDTDHLNKDNLLIYTEKSMGNGLIESIDTVIYLENDKFDNTKTIEMQKEIEELNDYMKKEGKDYILIAPGRWGSRDRFLGIPVRWAQISKAKVIVETGLEGFIVEASQGTHFFHNIVSMGVGYFTIPFKSEEDFIDWDWLKKQKTVRQTNYFNQIITNKPLIVKMNGKNGVAIIEKG